MSNKYSVEALSNSLAKETFKGMQHLLIEMRYQWQNNSSDDGLVIIVEYKDGTSIFSMDGDFEYFKATGFKKAIYFDGYGNISYYGYTEDEIFDIVYGIYTDEELQEILDLKEKQIRHEKELEEMYAKQLQERLQEMKLEEETTKATVETEPVQRTARLNALLVCIFTSLATETDEFLASIGIMRTNTYENFYDEKVELTQEQLDYFYEKVELVKRATGYDGIIVNGDLLPCSDRLLACYERTHRIIVVDNFHIASCFDGLDFGYSLEEVLCHEIAHDKYHNHGRWHNKLTQELYEKVVQFEQEENSTDTEQVENNNIEKVVKFEVGNQYKTHSTELGFIYLDCIKVDRDELVVTFRVSSTADVIEKPLLKCEKNKVYYEISEESVHYFNSYKYHIEEVYAANVVEHKVIDNPTCISA